MKLAIDKSPILNFHSFRLFLNEKEFKVENNFTKELNDNITNEIYVKSYWFKSNQLILNNNHEKCIISINLIVNPKIWLFILISFIISIVISFIINNEFVWKLSAIFGLTWLMFQVYIYTFGYKKYIKINATYID